MPPAFQGRLPQRLPRMGTRAMHRHVPDAESYHMCLIPESIWVSGIRHGFMSFLEMGAAGSAPTVDIGEGSRLRSSNILDDGRGRQRPDERNHVCRSFMTATASLVAQPHAH